MIYKTIDPCAGIGGIRRGFEMTGCFKNVLSAEIDPYAAATYKHLFGDDPTNDLTSDAFKKTVDSTDYDVLLAGFPCQTFSKIGKQLGFRDMTRGTIFFDIADIISRTNPRAIFLENVENLLFHDHGNTIEIIIKTLEEELGYRVIGVTLGKDGQYKYGRESFIRNSKDFGVPQNRPRVYIMAFSKKKYGNAIKMLNEQLPMSENKIVYRDVFEILDEDVDDQYYMAQGYLDTLKKHKARNHNKGNGFGYCVVNKNNGEHPIAHTILATGGSGKERNLIYQPKEGVSGKMIKRKTTALNSEGIRVMTPNEWGRLQGFIGYGFIKDGNDEFSFPPGTTDGQKYKQLGNSVSIPVIESMAEFMLKCFNTLEQQQEDVVKAMADNGLFFTKRDVMELLGLSSAQVGALLNKMMEKELITCIPGGRTSRYVKNQPLINLPAFNQEEKVLEMASKKEIVTNEEIKNILGTTAGSVNVLLCGMTRKGLLIRVSRGKYKKALTK